MLYLSVLAVVAVVGQLEPESAPVETSESSVGVSPVVANDASALVLQSLQKIVAAADSEQRAVALRQAVQNPDVGLVDALTYFAVHDNDVKVARVALECLAAIGGPQAASALRALVNDVRHANGAIDLLSQAQAPNVEDLLWEVAAQENLANNVRRRAVKALEERFPQRLARQPIEPLAGPRALPSVAGGMFGGYALYTVGLFSKTGAGQISGLSAGALLGAGAGFLLGSRLTVDEDIFITSFGVWGAYAGMMAAVVADATPSEELVFGLGTLGELLGLGLGIGFSSLDISARDMILIDLNGAVAALATLGATGFADNKTLERPDVALLTLGGSAVGLAATSALSSKMRFSGGDYLLSVLFAAEGAWIGSWAPDLFESENSFGGFLLGGGLGLFAGEGLAQMTSYAPRDVLHAGLVTAYGHLLGTGVALLTRSRDKSIIAAQLATGVAGTTAALALSDQVHYSHGDYVLVPAMTILGGWHAAVLGTHLRDTTRTWKESQTGGLVLTTGATAGLAGMALGQVTDFSAGEAGMTFVSAVWGAWLFGWASANMDLSSRDRTDLTLLGTDVGLAAGALLLSPVVELRPAVLGTASLGGLAGAGIATLIMSLVTGDSTVLINANLVGTAVGLLGGGIAGYFLFQQPKADTSGPATSLLPFDINLPRVVFLPQPAIDRRGRADGVLLTASLLPTP